MKTQVIVTAKQVQSYLDRGYERSERSPRLVMGEQAWMMLTKAERGELMVVEIDAEEHARLVDTNPKKYRLYPRGMQTYWTHVGVNRVRVLEELPDAAGVRIANEERDSPPEEWGKHDLFDTPQECIAAKREFIEQVIHRLRTAAGEWEKLLRRYE